MQQSVFNVIDINNEFSLLTELIGRLWDGCDTEQAQEALRLAFQQGLGDGKLWIDEYVTMRIAKVLNGNDEVCFPLSQRTEKADDDNVDYFYDALYKFDSNLSRGISKIHRSVTGYGRWDYSKNASQLCNRLNMQFPGIEVFPKDQDRESQNAIANAYAGLHAEEAGSYPTPKRLLKSYVTYSLEEQGLSFFRSLFSVVYSHALYCAKEFNTQSLVRDLLPIYEKRNDPLNFDNGDEILSIALNNPFVAVVHQLSPFTFSSTEEYLASKARKAELALTKETEEEKESRVNALLEEMMKNIDAEIKKEDDNDNTVIDSIRPSFAGFVLA